jgi:hypothetical protein
MASPIKNGVHEMDLFDLLTTIKHRLNQAVVFGISNKSAALLTSAIDTCAACCNSGRVLEDAEIEAAIEKTKQDLEEYKHQMMQPETIVEVQTMDDLTAEQSEALNELVSEAQALGFYDVQEKTPLDANG